jgi:hypothetical protein
MSDDAERDCVDDARVDSVVPIPRHVAVSMPAEGAGPWKEPYGCGDVLPKVQGRPPLNQWREVCRWDEGPTPPAFEGLKIDWRKVALSTLESEADLKRLCESLAAAFEELAGEHRIALGALRAQDLLIPPCPSSPGWYWVRGHWRSRAQNSAAIEPDHPTVQADPAAGEIDPLQGQGEARNADGTPYIVGESGVGSAIPQSGEERSE